MSENIKAAKDKIRKKILLKRKRLSKNTAVKLSVLINKKVLSIKKLKSAKTYLVYLPIDNEVDTKLIIHFLVQNNKKMYIPAFKESEWVVSKFASIDDLEKNKYNTLQPKKISAVSSNEIDVAIVPGVAFSKTGVRLGFGKSVYDKLLSNFEGLKVGLAYDFQVVNLLPAEVHDLKMDLVIAEDKIVDLRTT